MTLNRTLTRQYVPIYSKLYQIYDIEKRKKMPQLKYQTPLQHHSLKTETPRNLQIILSEFIINKWSQFFIVRFDYRTITLQMTDRKYLKVIKHS